MEESKRTSVYAAPGIPYSVAEPEKKTIIRAIADAWDIPEDKVLSTTDILDKEHSSPSSQNGERIRTKGERAIRYVNARKFYFYVMIEVMHYSWSDLTKITGRKIAAMKYANTKAQEHMRLEKDYMDKAQKVLDLIEQDRVIFPKPVLILEANVKVIDRRGVYQDPPKVQLSGLGERGHDENDTTHQAAKGADTNPY